MFRINRIIAALLITAAALSAQQGPVDTRPLIAVTDLIGQGISPDEAAVVSEQVRVAIAKTNRFRIIERNQMQDILKEQGFQQSGCTSDECAVETGQLLGVRYMFIGSVGVAGSYTILTLRAIDVGSGENRVNESIKEKNGIDALLAHGIDDLVALVDKNFSKERSSVAADASSSDTAKKRHPVRTALIASLSALAVGGGVTAALFLSRDNDPAPATGGEIAW